MPDQLVIKNVSVAIINGRVIFFLNIWQMLSINLQPYTNLFRVHSVNNLKAGLSLIRYSVCSSNRIVILRDLKLAFEML